MIFNRRDTKTGAEIRRDFCSSQRFSAKTLRLGGKILHQFDN